VVEQWTENPRVAGSTPALPNKDPSRFMNFFIPSISNSKKSKATIAMKYLMFYKTLFCKKIGAVKTES
jgi:hypothetical protein